MAIQVSNMCSNNPNSTLVPFGLKLPGVGNPAGALSQFPGMSQAAFDFHRAQLYDYTARLAAYGLRPTYPLQGLYPQDALAQAFFMNRFDPRTRFIHEEPKPSQSYIGLIAMAILSSKDKKLVLSDIYQWILDNYSYFRNRGPGWRNSIRHNLSLNDCFIKAGRSANGKGHYWAVHPANVEDFTKGDFRRRRAQRKVRKYMGLSVPDGDDSPSPSPSPTSAPNPWLASTSPSPATSHQAPPSPPRVLPAKKRLFDMESLLAPDTPHESSSKRHCSELDTATSHSDNESDVHDADHDDTDNTDNHNKLDLGAPVDMTQHSQPLESSGHSLPRLAATTASWSSLSHSQPGLAATTASWSSMTNSSQPQFPTMIDAQTAAIAAQQWQETFSKILDKSYQTELKIDIQ